MTDDYSFNFVFKYMEHEVIPYDASEFLFQIKSHPDYPTLLSISDTLTFFNINNGAIRLDVSKLDLLPDHFIGLLKEANDESQLYFINRKEDKFVIMKEKTLYEIDRTTLEERWLDLVLLIEAPKEEKKTSKKRSNYFWFLPSLFFGILLATLFQSTNDFFILLFFILPITGIMLSIAALRELFGAKNNFITAFCNVTSYNSCFSVVSSQKWSILKHINFSDLSIVFFASQLFGLLLFLLADNIDRFFDIQKIIVLGAVPIILLSIYYQKFVEKKWCPICLMIGSIIIIEAVYLLLFFENQFIISYNATILFSFVFTGVILVWILMKKSLLEQKELKEFQLKANRFLRNYEVFRNSLRSGDKKETPTKNVIFMGNPDSETQITVITNPFCGHCKEVHEILDTVLAKYRDRIAIKVIIKTNFELDNEETKDFFRTLMTNYLEKGEKEFNKLLRQFFISGNIKEWLNKHKYAITERNEVDNIYKAMNQWCINNNINYTPAIFINGYEYPKAYERKDIVFFIEDLIEDEAIKQDYKLQEV
ncbi:thioredoxin domain-containing protein [Leptobacterium sp. I13]|uniref:thioredoxin domain-containing protein n=1 Tax=Leptobacterium meishanense TaxID=3128904 RepID=UPI0030EF505F